MMTRKMVGGLALAAALMLASVAVFGHRGRGQEGWRGFGAPQDGPHGGRGFGPGGPGRRGPGGPRGGLLGPLGRDLNLSDAQKEQLKQIETSLAESTKGLHEQLFKAGGDPAGWLTEGAFDEAAVRAAAQARAAIHVELEVARARAFSQVYAVLTAEQKAKLAERRQQFEQKRREFEPRAEDVPDGR